MEEKKPLRRRRPPETQKGREGGDGGGSDTSSPLQSPAASHLISFSKEASAEAVQCVLKRLQARGLECELLTEDDSQRQYLRVTAGFGVLADQASKEHFMMQLKNSEEMAEFCAEQVSDFELSADGKLFTSAEELRLLYHVMESTPYDTEDFKSLQYQVPKVKGFLASLHSSCPCLIEEDFPLHNPREMEELKKMWWRSLIPLKGIKVEKIRRYFGEKTAFYFAWMNFYSSYILVPALLGILMYLLRGADTTVDTDAYLPFYSVFMALWGVFFLVHWQRRSAVHSFKWNTHTLNCRDELNPDYHGVLRKDPIMDEDFLYYPTWRRHLWYLVSVLATLPLLLGGVAVMTLSLNLNGYVRNRGSPIYVGWLAQYAEPGRVFAGDSPYYLWLVPTLGHSIVVFMVNQLYSEVARKCTDWENHRTMSEYHSALVVKRVVFECFDCFMPLFYVAFYQLDVITLRAEIVSLFMSDEIRRVTMECIVPLVMAKCANGSSKFKHKDVSLSDYTQFDDYLEMVIQFGYITLFASAFPLGGAVTMVFIYVELRSDVFKLLHAYRRPEPLRCKDIGVWFKVMQVMVFVGILTNCAILGFSSEQLMQWAPSLFSREDDGGDQVMAMGSGRYVVGIVFGFEHLLLVVAVLLQWSIHPVPKWVRVAIARREHLATKRAAAAAERSSSHLQEERREE